MARAQDVTALAEHLHALIRTEGPITVARFVAETLGHPRHGYYTTRDPFGAAGDFTTAPEISQMFGELLGLWCAETWRLGGGPRPAHLVELGPGRGTLMADALRAIARAAPDCREALQVHLVETSPALRARQADCLGAAGARWHDCWESVPPGPVLVLANEFLDALPVHQLVRHGGGWRERLVGLDPAGNALRFELSEETPAVAASLPRAIAESAERLPEGSVVELRPAADALARALAARIEIQGIAALFVDYGHGASAAGDTLQAVRGHRYADVLDSPGTADITAHVDFAAFAEAARAAGAAVHGPVPQGRFLRALGIETRADALCRGKPPDQVAAIAAATRRLIHPAEMGTVFKVLALTRASAAPPPGFESAA